MGNHKFYSYQNRKGVLPISWADFHGLCKGLAGAVYPYKPDIVIGIARGGLYPGTLISHILRKEFYPVRITRRLNDAVAYEHPQWLVKPPSIVRGQKILIVDEICDSGETIRLVKDELEKLQAKEMRAAVLYAHQKGVDVPDYIGIISNALILNPWDREIYQAEQFIIHPEYVHAFGENNLEIESSYLPNIAVLEPQKMLSA
jgi:hypoxanthine phosphoribosyltransferase